MIKIAAIFALAFAKVDVKEVDELISLKEPKRRREPLTIAGISATITSVYASVAPYVKKGIKHLGTAADVKDNVSTLIGNADKNRYVGIEIKNAFGNWVNLEYKGMYLDYGFVDKSCSPTIKPAEIGNCGISKTASSWSGVYGVAVYRAKHGAPFATNKDDYWVDFAIMFGNPQRFWQGKNVFGVYVAPSGKSLQPNQPLFTKMYRDTQSGFVRGQAQDNRLLKQINNGVRVQAVMTNDYKPLITVEVWPDTALFDSHKDAWGDLRTFYDRECYSYKITMGMTWDHDCKAYWLHSFSDFKTSGYTYLGAQEMCLKNAACHSFYWSTARNQGWPLKGEIEEYESTNEPFSASENQWSYLAGGANRGWGVLFFGGTDCDLATCSSGNCVNYDQPAWRTGSPQQYKCRWTPTNVISTDNVGRREEENEM